MSQTRSEEHTLEQHRTVRVSRRIDAPPERIFDAWLEPASVKRWMGAPSASEVVSVAVDPSVGGTFSFVVHQDGANVAHTGAYLTLDRPTRLSFTWRVPRFSLETSVVTIDIARAGEGGESEVTLQHEGVLAELEARTEQGWSTILESVAVSVRTPDEATGAQEDGRPSIH
jgi:uncharacterized protein YndB with AHSA1/START domain